MSSLYNFAQEKKWDPFRKTLLATSYYCAFLATDGAVFGTPFVLIMMVYPLVEGNTMLARELDVAHVPRI
jgi:hypothetical protein